MLGGLRSLMLNGVRATRTIGAPRVCGSGLRVEERVSSLGYRV